MSLGGWVVDWKDVKKRNLQMEDDTEIREVLSKILSGFPEKHAQKINKVGTEKSTSAGDLRAKPTLRMQKGTTRNWSKPMGTHWS